MKLIDGKEISKQIKQEIAAKVAKIIDNEGRRPHLAAILVGEDPASQTYVKAKDKACKEVGFLSSIYKYPGSISEKELLEIIDFLNNDDEIDGFIVQLPLPNHINDQKILEMISPKKDVDGFRPVSFGRMALGLNSYIPATPNGIMELLKRYEIETEGKHCVVLGRSHIVGLPISVLMAQKSKPGNSTVTICHSRTKNIKEICASADILIVAIGKAGFVTKDMVKEGAVVIDVGIHRVPSDQTKSGFRLVGDVSFDEVAEKCSYITPVPGGVGPMTIASLLLNTFKAYNNEVYK